MHKLIVCKKKSFIGLGMEEYIEKKNTLRHFPINYFPFNHIKYNLAFL